MSRGFKCNCPQCGAKYDLCPAARELEEIITALTAARDEALKQINCITMKAHLDRVRPLEADRDRLRSAMQEIATFTMTATSDPHRTADEYRAALASACRAALAERGGGDVPLSR